MAMSRISRRFLIVALPAGILLCAVAGVATRRFGLFTILQENRLCAADVSRLSTYRIPDSLNFCGERMPLKRTCVRERMEQAFYTELSDAQIILDLKRSTKYFPYIEERLREMNLPEDLKYLAVAESALRNLVSDRGAVGIWQFTEDTARRYGLIVNYYVDERYDFQKSTDAALRYLSDLHTMFGSWTLAAAAYNMGQNGVKMIVRYQMVNNYYDLHLNDETSRFVFRIVAIKQIMTHYKTYGFELRRQDFYRPPETRTVEISHIGDLALWAREQGTSYGAVKYLNPWLRNRSLPRGAWTIDLPESSQPVVLASAMPVDSSDTLQSNLTYVVRRGDSLIGIARTYGVTVSDLIAWNGLRGSHSLRAGQKLMIFANEANLER